jgi:hypothetical protein
MCWETGITPDVSKGCNHDFVPVESILVLVIEWMLSKSVMLFFTGLRPSIVPLQRTCEHKYDVQLL